MAWHSHQDRAAAAACRLASWQAVADRPDVPALARSCATVCHKLCFLACMAAYLACMAYMAAYLACMAAYLMGECVG